MNTLMLCPRILSTFSFIFSFSATSRSAILLIESTLIDDPNTLILSVSIGVLAIRMRAFLTVFGWWTPGFLSNRKPSSRNDSSRHPPSFLMRWMAVSEPEPFRRSTASTANFAKCSLCCDRIFELSVVRAMFSRSSRKRSALAELSAAAPCNAVRAAFAAKRHPAMMVCGCSFCSTSFSASRISSEANTVTEVVPSPTSSSCTRDMSTRILAAGLSTPTAFRIVAPSLVTSIWPALRPWATKILSMPFGPRVLFTSSPMAMAPTNDDRRAISPFSSSASCFRIRTGFRDTIFTDN
uniref:Putative secreted protein n=1 Tax=Anopheles darlingi TaxID=43151 RepID=A0A2M4D3C5_ANODA